MIVKTPQDPSTSPKVGKISLCSSFGKASLSASFRKISLCAKSLFSFITEEGNAWKGFFANNYYISKLCTLGSRTTASIARKFFSPSQPANSNELPKSSLEQLTSSNTAWIRDHSLYRKKYPKFQVSDEALLDLILKKSIDSKGVIKFTKGFSAYTRNEELRQSADIWEKAYKIQQQIQEGRNQPGKIEEISKKLSEKVQNLKENDHFILLFEKGTKTTDSPLSYYIKYVLNQVRSTHDKIYTTVYAKVKEQLQDRLNTTWKKKLFTEIQEEIRAILLGQYSNLHQESTLGHHLPSSLQQLLSGNSQFSAPKESLSGLIWDLLLQNGVTDASDKPIPEEKLNQIFEKEFEMITRHIESVVMTRINQLVDKAGKDLQPLLQIWHNQLPQKEQGWLEIKYHSYTYCRITLCARDRESPVTNIGIYRESSPMKMYTYEVPKHLLQGKGFLELLQGKEEEDAPISSSTNLKKFLSQYECLSETYSPSNAVVASQGLLDYIKVYHLDTTEASVDSTEKTFFQMRMHAFINYCKTVEDKSHVSDETLIHVENGVSALLEGANTLYDAGQLSDEEYIGIIATGIEIEECVLEKQQALREEVQSSEIVVPAAVKEQVRKMFASSGLTQLDVENIKSFAKVLLGNDMSEEIALLCKELPIATDKSVSLVLPHTTLWKTVKTLCLDVKNLRASPVAVFRIYTGIRKLLKNIKSLVALVSYIPYIYLVVACCTNPVTAVACLVGGAIALYMLFNVPELEPVLNFLGAALNFQKELYNFLLTRLILRAIQLADKVLHCSTMTPMKMGRSLLMENVSNRLSFSLSEPLDPNGQKIPPELMPLQKFHPHLEIWADTDKENEVSDISIPELSMEFAIQEHNGVKRAYMKGQPGFWIADVITDRRLESLDFAHLVLENTQGHQKICMVPRAKGRLILQTVLKMANSYSRKTVDILSNAMHNAMLESPNKVYYYDVVDGELVTQDLEAISYLITHYMASGDTTRSQKLVDELKKKKATTRLAHPNATLKTIEQIAAIAPNLMHSDWAKVVLELSSLCKEIPVDSRAFPLFLRAYQYYIESKQEGATAYLSEAQEALLAKHLQEYGTEEKILSKIGKMALAAQTPLVQTLLLLGNNIMDESLSTFFGKEPYVPTTLKNYELQRQYVQGEKNLVTFLMGLMLNNLVNPYFSINKDMVNSKKIIGDEKINIFEALPLVLSKLNAEKNTVKIDYLLAVVITLAYLRQYQSLEDIPITESIKRVMPIFEGVYALARDNAAAFSTEPTNAFKIEEKSIGLIQYLLELLPFENVDTFGVGKAAPDSYLRHIIQSGITTVSNYMDAHKKSNKQQLLNDTYTRVFPALQMGQDYKSLNAFEQSILGAYQEISKTFLQKQDKSIPAGPTVAIQPGSSTENQIMNIADWYGTHRDREENTSFYTLQSNQKREDLIKKLDKTYHSLQERALQQEKTIEHLLTHPSQNLSVLESQIKEHTQDLKNKVTAIDQTQEEIEAISSQQSLTQKIGTFVLGYINSLLEAPTLGKINLSTASQIEQLVEQKKNLIHETESITAKRQRLFHNIITAFKTKTSLRLSEVYDYFCQGKDDLIVESLKLNDEQWKVMKEELYRYMLVRKYLSIAENLNTLSRNPNQGLEKNIDLIGYELDAIFPSVQSEEDLELSVRGRLQLEKKFGKSLSLDVQDKLKQIVNGSMANFHSIYEFSSF